MPMHVAVTDHTQPKVFYSRLSSVPIVLRRLIIVKTKLMTVSR